jgi:hypothetical protein
MQITHEEAHRLIQFNADEPLHADERMMLSRHLEACLECRVFAEGIKEVESLLLPVMKKRWDLPPLPLSIAAIRGERKTKTDTNIILATRIAAVSVVLLAFIFSVWQFTLSGGQGSSQMPVGALPVPTPSTQSTSTKVTFQTCQEMLYVVQEHDTLESIADQFSTSKEEIMAANRMITETVNPNMELVVPIFCNFTPTGTINPTTHATAYTPSQGPTTSTPDG